MPPDDLQISGQPTSPVKTADRAGPMHRALHFVPVALGRPDVVTLDNAFATEEIALIEAACLRLPLEHKLIGPAGEIKHNQLDAHVGALSNTPDTAWFYLKLEKLLQAANALLRVSVWGITEEVQYTTYNDGRYCWHVDAAMPEDGLPRPARKLSFELMLSPSGEYEGGAREHMGQSKLTAKLDRGTLIVFPSSLLTRVYNVTGGTRRSIEGWVCGPEFA
jgi:hypothetical protein